MPTAAIKLLHPHPAQMRTTYDLESLATLTLQLYARGLDDWQPIVASANGDGFHIVSGHRRHMAQLLAFALRDWAEDHPDVEIDIEVVRTMLAALVESLGTLEKVIASLLVRYGEEEISFAAFAGGQKAQILALHAANYGSEKPDALGVAHSFRQAVVAGATPEEIARNSGQHLNYVLNHLALTDIPPELAQRIAAGELPMSVATAVADLPDPKRSGLAIFILANPAPGTGQTAGRLTAKAIQVCAATLKKWPGLQMPLIVKHQSQRNIARALVHLWGQVVTAYPEDAYAAAAMLIYRNLHEEPWRSQEKLTLWFQALGGDTYFGTEGINWTAVVEYLVTEVSCQTCPLAQLPRQLLRSDLSQGQGGPLGMPCRTGEAASRCVHGLAPQDHFDVRVPWEWGQHAGVVNEGGDYRVKNYADLLSAWQSQAAKEEAEDEARLAAANDEPEAAAALPQQMSSQVHSQQPDETSAPTKPAPDSPIVKQRRLIADFMKRHEQMAVHHPFATPCGRCRHRLDSSPTKDESVPHCAWAGRLRHITFQVLEPDDQNAPRVPVCRQFAPNQPWPDLISTHPEPPGVPREWLQQQILHLVKEANRYNSNRNAFEFLTGRPMGANENYGDWFSQQLEAQSGDLNEAQLFTLFIWAHTEWRRALSSPFSLPVNGHGLQFAAYQEQPWRIEEAV